MTAELVSPRRGREDGDEEEEVLLGGVGDYVMKMAARLAKV